MNLSPLGADLWKWDPSPGPGWSGPIRAAVAGLLGFYLLLSLPIVSGAIAGGDMARVTDPARIGTTDAIVVLDGDNRRGRTRTAIALAAGSPSASVVVLGQPWIADALVESGLDAGRITLDGRAGTTREQMTQVGEIVASRPDGRFAVVASRLQMPRVAALARAMSLASDRAVLVSAPVDDEPATGGLRSLVPTYLALRISRDGLYERAALPYYAWRGWTGEGRDRH